MAPTSKQQGGGRAGAPLHCILIQGALHYRQTSTFSSVQWQELGQDLAPLPCPNTTTSLIPLPDIQHSKVPFFLGYTAEMFASSISQQGDFAAFG